MLWTLSYIQQNQSRLIFSLIHVNKLIWYQIKRPDIHNMPGLVLLLKFKFSYNQSNALTKAVNRNGSGTQNHSGSTTKNPIVTIREIKK